jgi:hypothetical protein
MSEFFGLPGQLIIDWLIQHPWRSAVLAALIVFAVVAYCRWDGNPDVFERSDRD